MKSQMSYKAKRNAIIVAVIVVLAILASVGTYLFISGNDETQAMAQMNGTSTDRAGEEVEQAQNDNNQEVADQNNNDQNADEQNNEEENTEQEENTNNDETETTTNNNAVVNNNNDNNTVNNDNDDDTDTQVATQTQTVTTTEQVETTETLVGFTPASFTSDVAGLNAIMSDLSATVEAVTGVESNYVINGMEVTYNIKLTSSEALEGINVSAIVPEGTELVEDSISDEGTVDENGKISWKVDVDTEKTVSFKVTVTETSGEVVLNATVNGKDLSVSNVIDEAPVVTAIDSNKYQMEVGTEYVEKGYSAIDKEDGDITDKVELSYRFQAKDAPTWENPDPTELDTSRLGVYKITYTVTDSMGNVGKATRVVEIVDTQAPVIEVKDGTDKNGEEYTIGNDPYFSRVSFKLSDNVAVKEFEINGKVFPLTANTLSDANFDAIQGCLIEGVDANTIILRDTSGNEASKTFTYDITDPVLTVKDGTDNNGEKFTIGNYPDVSRVSFGLSDNIALDKYIINGIEVAVSKEDKIVRYGDANYINNLEKNLKEGENTIILIDMAGNEATETFNYDTKAPEATFVRIQNNTEEGASQEYAKVGSKIWVYVIFDEKLSVEPEFTIAGVPAKIIQREDGEDKAQTWYKYAAEVTMTEDMTEGNIEFTINGYKDLAGNQGTEVSETTDESAITFDKTPPRLEVKYGTDKNGEFTVGNEPYFSRISFKLHDNMALKEYVINGSTAQVTKKDGIKTSDANYQNIKKHLKENEENTIVLIDRAGNKSEEYTFYYDTTPAVRSATNILVLGDSNNNKEFYATIGDTIQAYVSFNEKLAHNPTFILINDGKEYTMDASLVTAQEPNKDGKYVYQILYKIEEDTTFVDGEITLRVTDLEDMYGNKIADETKPTNGHIVYFDTTPPMLGEGHPLYILNRDDAENRKYIANGEYLRVEANFSEELAEEPVLTIGSGENTQVAPLKSSKYSETSGNYVYVWDIKLDNSILKLEDGTIVPFTITNVVDKAGNTATFDNDDVTPYKDIYDQVTYDNTPAVYDTLGILNVTHYRQNDKEGASEDLTYATTGDEVRVLISFNEKLTVEPKVKINGNDELVYDMTFREDSSSDTVFYYMADFVIEEDMNFPEDEITFEVYGYEDVAGNESEKLDNSDINSDSYKKVVYDKTAPVITNIEDGDYIKTPIYAIVEEENFASATITRPNGVTEDYPITNGQGQEVSAEGEYTITIKDKVGQETTVTFTIDRTAPTFNNLTDGTIAQSVDLGVTDDNFDYILITNNDTDYSWKEARYWTSFSLEGNFTVQAFDKAGNTSEIKSFTIDRTAPSADVSYSHDKENPTMGNVTVTLSPKEEIKDIEGWTKKDDGTFSKEFEENGEYDVTIEDLAGNFTVIKFVVNGIDREAPVITLEEDDVFEVGVNTYAYPEEGSVTDNYDATRSLASAVHMHWYKVNDDGTETEVTPFKWGSTLADRDLGKYHITYETSDKAGNTAKADRYVTLQDTTAPVIKVNEKDTFQIGVDTYDYPEDITVTDNRDGNMPVGDVNIVWYYATPEGGKGEVAYSENFPWDTNLKGVVEPGTTYYIEYWIEDAEGNRGEAYRLLTFVDNTDPEVTLKGDSEIHLKTVEDAADYKDAGVTVVDNSDENVQIQVQINWFEIVGEERTEYDVSSVGVNGAGRYNIVYTATDASGNETVVQRLVYVGM